MQLAAIAAAALILGAAPAMAQSSQLDLDYRVCETHRQTVQYSIPNKFGAGPSISRTLDEYESGWESCVNVAAAYKAAIDALPLAKPPDDDATRARLRTYRQQQ